MSDDGKNFGRDRQSEIYLRGLRGGEPEVPVGVADAVDGRAKVLFDSGIRTGADIFKALALGAEAVMIGRPYCYGLAVGGQAGVTSIIRNYKADLDLTMGLAGCRSLDEIEPDRITRRSAAGTSE